MPKTVFVSYSWSVEEKTNIVDELEKQCKLHNIKLIRDDKTMQKGDRISQFMERIASADYVITVFSQKYFESEFCMYELMKIQQKGDFEGRIYPVMAEGDLVLNNSDTRRKFIKFWETKVVKESIELDGVDKQDAPSQYDALNLYEQFKVNIDNLMANAGDILATQSQTLQKKQFASILDLISPLYDVPPSAIFEPRETDQNFMDQVQRQLQEELDKSDHLRKAIAKELDAVGSDENSDKLAEKIINLCGCEDDLEELLNNFIQEAVEKSLKRLSTKQDNDSPSTIKIVQQLTQSADKLFSCLVMFAIQKQWMADYQQGCSAASSNLRYMPFGTAATVEIVTSRHLQRLPRFKLNSAKTEAIGEEGVMAFESGFETDDIVTGILKQIWVKVFPESIEENLNEKRLQSQIRMRHKKNKLDKNNYYLIVPDDENHPLSNVDVRNELIQRLPQLPLIILKSDSCEDALLIANDEDLMSIIVDFYQILDEYRPYEPDKNNRRPEEN